MTQNIREKKENLLLKIGGMQCSFCVDSIKKAYQRVDGVSQVGVSLSHEETMIQYDPVKVSETQLKKTIESLGFKIRDPTKTHSYDAYTDELHHYKRQLSIASIISAVSLVIMALTWLNVNQTWFPLVMLALTLSMIFIVGLPILKMAYASVIRGIYNQHVLMEFGAFGGLLGGLIGFFIQPWPMADFMGAAIFITTYHILSGYVSIIVRTTSSQAIQKLMSLQPDTARVINAENGTEEEIPVEEVQLDDLVRVLPGESIPVDGVVVEGQSTVNQSVVTGESLPELKVMGNEVIGGSINQNGTLVIKTTKIGKDSFLSQVSRSIQEARTLKPQILQIVEKVLKYFVPGVLISALVAFFIWTIGSWVILGEIQFQKAVFATLAVLVMGYPCALGMATPLAMIRGSGIAAQYGILMRSGEAFQVFKDVSVVAVDKTGTLTEGKPTVLNVVVTAKGFDEDKIIALAASVEQHSEHPLGRAIVEYAQKNNIRFIRNEITNLQVIPGLGIHGFLNSERIIIGSPRLLKESNINFERMQEKILELENKGRTVIGISKKSELLGIIGIADILKVHAKEGIMRMRKEGLEPIMITGDNKRTANVIAKQVGITNVIAEALPQEKAEYIRQLQSQNKRVAMVGDGINDAPALMQADVGIAIGAGTDIAIESADIILVHNNISGVVDAYEIGKNSYNKTKQNVILAFLFNGVGIPIAVIGLLHPVLAMIAMATSVSTVLLNSFGGKIISKPKQLVRKDKFSDTELSTLIISISTIRKVSDIQKFIKALTEIEGIKHAEGNIELKQVIIRFKKDQVTLGQIYDAVQKTGGKISEILL